jgi:hypothetical protein
MEFIKYTHSHCAPSYYEHSRNIYKKKKKKTYELNWPADCNRIIFLRQMYISTNNQCREKELKHKTSSLKDLLWLDSEFRSNKV